MKNSHRVRWKEQSRILTFLHIDQAQYTVNVTLQKERTDVIEQYMNNNFPLKQISILRRFSLFARYLL